MSLILNCVFFYCLKSSLVILRCVWGVYQAIAKHSMLEPPCLIRVVAGEKLGYYMGPLLK